MTDTSTRRAFQLFHAALGLGLLSTGVMGLAHALPDLGGHAHFAFVAGLRTLGAVLLLVPRTARWGGAALLVVLLPGFVFELVHGDWEVDLLVYAAGVWLVMVRGAQWGASPPR